TLGGPRPGATILALTTAPGGGIFPVVAVQRYGQGRSMIFAGEASWRWKMMAASSDRAYEFFWRQAARWLSSPSPDPVAITVPDAPEPGDAISIDVDARDATFAPVPDAAIDATLTAPGGATESLKLRHADATSGRFTSCRRRNGSSDVVGDCGEARSAAPAATGPPRGSRAWGPAMPGRPARQPRWGGVPRGISDSSRRGWGPVASAKTVDGSSCTFPCTARCRRARSTSVGRRAIRADHHRRLGWRDVSTEVRHMARGVSG